MSVFDPAIYDGIVHHVRLHPFRHRFAYRVFALWLPLDDLEKLSQKSRWFGYRQRRLMQFDDRDHGLRNGDELRPWIAQTMIDAGLSVPDGRIMMLCYPRLFGYVFNPLTVYFLYQADERLAAVIYEVKNTFGEQHCYVMPVPEAQTTGRLIRQTCDKIFYVSPFLPVVGHYRFSLRQPDEKFSLLIRQFGADHEQLVASFVGHRLDWNDANLLKMWRDHPLMTIKVMTAIHWQALILWRKGAQYVRRLPHKLKFTVGKSDTNEQ
jgi:DUF1365 family protein